MTIAWYVLAGALVTLLAVLKWRASRAGKTPFANVNNKVLAAIGWIGAVFGLFLFAVTADQASLEMWIGSFAVTAASFSVGTIAFFK